MVDDVLLGFVGLIILYVLAILAVFSAWYVPIWLIHWWEARKTSKED